MRLIKYEIIKENFPKFYLFLFIELLRKSLFVLFFFFFINRKLNKFIKNLKKQYCLMTFLIIYLKLIFLYFLIIISPIL